MAEYTEALIVSTGVVFWTIGFVMVVCRFWMRLQSRVSFIGVDDWLILFASALVGAMTSNAILGCVLGTMGRDNQPVTGHQTFVQNKINYIQVVIEKPAYGAIKASVLFFYRRIFLAADNFRKANNFVIVLTICWTIAFFGASVFRCGAYPAAAWDPEVEAMHSCANQWAILLCFALTDVLLNILIVWMPYPQLQKLRSLETKKRWAISCFFMLGGLDTLISFVRMAFIILTQTIPAFNTHFQFRQGSAPLFWTVLEATIGVIACNLAALAPLFRGHWRDHPRRLYS